MRGDLSSGQNSGQCTWLFTLLRRREDQRCDFIPLTGLWPMACLDGQGFGRNITEKLGKRKSG